MSATNAPQTARAVDPGLSRGPDTNVSDIDLLCINTIRTLSMDAVQKANSGHPGLPIGAADVATVLFSRFMNFDPKNPLWPDRDRFVLSAGHGSMLQFALLHLMLANAGRVLPRAVLIDRVWGRAYVGDNGGQVWRVDFGDASPSNWTVLKLASLGDLTTAAGRRKFQFAPDVIGGSGYDMVVIGSGDREHPFGVAVDLAAWHTLPLRALLFGEAQGRAVVSTANAEAVRAVAAAMHEPGGINAANLKVAEIYIQAFGNLAKAGNTLIVPANLSDVASLVSSAMTVINQLRTLVAHLWENEGEAMTVTAQYLDSVNVPPPSTLPALWAPTPFDGDFSVCSRPAPVRSVHAARRRPAPVGQARKAGRLRGWGGPSVRRGSR